MCSTWETCPATRTLNMLGVEPFVRLLADLGFRELHESEFYGPSLALGAADVSLWETVGAYRCLASGGVRRPMSLEAPAAIADRRRVLSPEAAYIISDVLSDREGRSRTFSLESPLATRYWTAVKTGTSKDMRDNWCVGYSELYTVGVWTGNFAGDPMWNVSGMSGAAPVWVEVMNYLHRAQPSRAPKSPPGLQRFAGEWFVAGTATSAQPVSAGPGETRIAYPADGTIIALDPDIPPEQQRVFFESRPSAPGLRWLLNGEDIGTASSLRLWPPSRGSYRLSLVDPSRRVVDSVAFSVR
jgi:penicillin-binding protein 1C